MRVNLEEAIALLKQGQNVAVPTETVYGLAGDARNAAAIAQIYAIKQRPANNPLIVHLADSHQVLDWASEFSPLAQKLADAFWPGPLTLVLPAKETVLPEVRAGEPTVALRVPAHPLMQAVLQKSGLALAAPSANQYTQLSPTTAAHVAQGLGDSVAVLDGGACDVGIESTIVYVDSNAWSLLRLGMISESQIANVAGCAQTKREENPVPKAPGQHLLHYSPSTPIRLFSSKKALIDYAEEQPNVALLLIGESTVSKSQTFTLSVVPKEAAAHLYDQLHQMDALGVEELLIEFPPESADWSAIRDRLQRAAHA